MSGYDRVQAEVALEKHPIEEEVFTADFTARLGTRNIQSVIGVTAEPAEIIISNIGIDSTTKKVQFKIVGGTAPKSLIVNTDISTDTNELIRGEGVLRIRDNQP